MSKAIMNQINSIFIGRTEEMEQLAGYWEASRLDQEHKVYVILNAPGTGKTSLVKHFGEMIENQGTGLYLEYACTSNFTSAVEMNLDIIKTIKDALKKKKGLVTAYIKQTTADPSAADDFNSILASINHLSSQASVTIGNIISVLKDLSRVIPFVLVADEIQEFQGSRINAGSDREGEGETALHYFTRMLKDLLRSNVLIILSGTRYHILSQIGEKIGSPIQGKVFPVIITKFELLDIKTYVAEVKRILEPMLAAFPAGRVASILPRYEQFLMAFSGGHPRTMVTITALLVENLAPICDDSRHASYAVFIEYFLPRVKQRVPQLLLGSDHGTAINRLATSAKFGIVKAWIVDRGFDGQFLGVAPVIDGKKVDDDDIREIIYQLMNIGVIVQNGQQNYYITSYFHLLAFLKQFDGPHEAFLRQVLDNVYFTWLCGGHAGLGYTFETIFASVLLSARGLGGKDNVAIPVNPSRLRGIEHLQGQPRWQDITIEPDVLYHFASARGIDMLVLQDEVLVAIQLSTSRSPDASKVDELVHEMAIVARAVKYQVKKPVIKGWMVSLFPIKGPERIDVITTAGGSLETILGKELYHAICEAKLVLFEADERGRNASTTIAWNHE